ncbi:autophagy-related protein 9A isoform X1 [Hypanus sabinus]|uniref:autophagy-related protein 9A isoform X1 n=1 Tax=Hypanus sabinus TaxID=79690 RepID=UPI0028C4DE26|nr:autophagy-related protein 9A isoform X1 [Hypanus sabinus]XP_059823449.1 autophagy-related protein 9A isoform X1 [Hypanus sabinus]XP_059823450.1 autophagy-related protein 9A isoform X1 [Hypanus sabinus]
MAEFSTEYQRLQGSDTDTPPGEEELLVHQADGSKSPWHHIENLDLFFSRIYHLHQKNGFLCMILSEMFELVQFVFVVAFTTFLVNCVDYDILFANKVLNSTHHSNQVVKVTLPDAFLPPHTCTARIRQNVLMVVVLLTAGVFWVHRLVKFIYNVCCYWEIRAFYKNALKIPMAHVPYYSWQEVQSRIIQAQREHLMCIQKRELSELDIYHRILRFNNYMVAMINKSLLPVRFRLPLLGELVFYTRGLRYNFELIFLWGPGSLFLNEWSLKPEYKKAVNRQELAQRLSGRILWIGITNLLLCPLVLVWQILYAFFSYAEVIKREPGSLGARCWSLYGRCYLRHFNELDHELQSRLGRGYKAASKYMSCFLSPLLTVLAKNVAFFAGSILAVLITLTVYDEDVLAVEHVLTTITLLGLCVTVCRCFIPDKHEVSCPEQLLKVVLSHVHYMPDHWQGAAHRYETRDQFAQLFQYKAVFILEELISPIVTPFILIFSLRNKSLEIIDFFRNFTVEVVGVGDTCSFAQMDIRHHGHPAWVPAGRTEASVYQQAEDGKTELSLMRFAITHPRWRPPPHSNAFISRLRQQLSQDPPTAGGSPNPDGALHSLNSLTEPQSLLAGLPSLPLRGPDCSSDAASSLRSFSFAPSGRQPSLPRATNSTGAPATAGSDCWMLSTESSVWEGLPPSSRAELASSQMSLHTLYMHEFHKQQTQGESTRHVWYRHESDESGESGPEEAEGNRPPPPLIPRSSTYPVSGNQPVDSRDPSLPLLSSHSRRYGGTGGFSSAQRLVNRGAMGGWAEAGSRSPQTQVLPEEGSEDELPSQTHQV